MKYVLSFLTIIASVYIGLNLPKILYYYIEETKDTFELKKDDWNCTQPLTLQCNQWTRK